MTKHCDLCVVGAGPSGLMAARTAAAKGLDVVLLERNEMLAPVKRGCCNVLFPLNEPYFGEERITADPRIFRGKPIIRGRRLAVEHVLGMLVVGDSFQTILEGYPWLEPERHPGLPCVCATASGTRTG